MNSLKLLILSALIISCGKEAGDTTVSPSEAKVITEEGVEGPKGETGATGEAGEDGITEVVDTSTKRAINEWQDPITGRVWLIGSSAGWSGLNYCDDPYGAPSQTDLYEAVLHGLFRVSKSLGGIEAGWITLESNATDAYLINTSSGAPFIDIKNKNLNYGVFCFKEGDDE